MTLRRNLETFHNNSNIKHVINSQKNNTTLAQLKKRGYLQTNNARQSKSINKLQRTRRYRTRNLKHTELTSACCQRDTPKNNPQRTTNNILYEIKNLVDEKRKARSIRQRTHIPESRRTYNRTSKELKSKFQEMQNESFENYVSNFKMEDNCI
jgi:hypothetical protein